MTKRLPSLIRLNKEIQTRRVTDSLRFLIQRRSELTGFEDLEDLFLQMDASPHPLLRGFEHHMVQVRRSIARAFWARNIAVGNTVLEELLFQALKNSATADVIGAVLKVIQKKGLHRPGMVLYPLHSFGVLGIGLLDSIPKPRIRLEVHDAGLLVAPQSNSQEGILAFVDYAVKILCHGRPCNRDYLEDLLRHPVLSWLTRNPILALKTRSFSATYYENQFFMLRKLRVATSLLFMLAAVQQRKPLGRLGFQFSSARVNNQETLDIKHYIVLETTPTKSGRLQVRRVPMNVAKAALAEISDLNIELNPRAWRRNRIAERVIRAAAKVEQGFLRFSLDDSRSLLDARARVFRKLLSSLWYFRRSFRPASDVPDPIVNLAIAFEVLLTDNYQRGRMFDVIQRRAGKALEGMPGHKRLQGVVGSVYRARGEVVHTGASNVDIDLSEARRAFVMAFVGVTERLFKLRKRSASPLATILGDR